MIDGAKNVAATVQQTYEVAFKTHLKIPHMAFAMSLSTLALQIPFYIEKML